VSAVATGEAKKRKHRATRAAERKLEEEIERGRRFEDDADRRARLGKLTKRQLRKEAEKAGTPRVWSVERLTSPLSLYLGSAEPPSEIYPVRWR
jgi:hypothetical protein